MTPEQIGHGIGTWILRVLEACAPQIIAIVLLIAAAKWAWGRK